MGKEYSQIIALFTILLVALNIFTGGSADESQKSLVRRKRNVICFFGLTGFVSGMVYETLKSVDKLDPLVIGPLLNGKLKNATFQGLSTLRNDSIIDAHCQGERVILNTLMSLSNVTFSCQWSQTLLLTFTGTVKAKVKDIQFHLEGTFDMDNGIMLDVNVDLTKLDGMSLGFSGLGPLNFVVRLIGNMVLNSFQHAISKKVATVLKSTLKSELSRFQFSI